VQTVTVKSTIGIVVLVFIVFYAMTSPDQAANIFHASWHAVVNVAHGVGHFLDKVTS
jgi:predicted membrane channel-forming protein YqfA (hemolysin III family)